MPVRDLKKELEVERLYSEINEAIEKGWTVKWEKVRQPRSIQQNKYYWALLTIYGIETGNTPDEMHADLKREYGMFYRKNGKAYLKSTATLNTKEFTTFIEWIKNHAGRNGVHLPSADYLKQNWQRYEQYVAEHKQYIGETHNG